MWVTSRGMAGWAPGNNINPNEAEWIPSAQTAVQPYAALYGWTQGLSYYCNCTNAEYDSFQATVTVRALKGWTVQGNYTYQRDLTWDGPYDTNYYFIYGPQNGAGGYGETSLLPHDQFTIAQNFDIPFGHGRQFGARTSRPVDAVLGGWTLGSITTIYSGIPFSLRACPTTAPAINRAPDRIIVQCWEAGASIRLTKTVTNGSRMPELTVHERPVFMPGEWHIR